MKKLAVYIILIFTSAFVNLCISQTETSIQDVVTAFNKNLEQNNSYEVVNTTIDLITKDETKSFTRNLDPSSEYIITAFGDNSIDKFTLDVNNGTSHELNYNSEKTTANVTVIIIKPSGNSDFVFTVKNAKYTGNNVSGNFAVIIYRKN